MCFPSKDHCANSAEFTGTQVKHQPLFITTHPLLPPGPLTCVLKSGCSSISEVQDKQLLHGSHYNRTQPVLWKNIPRMGAYYFSSKITQVRRLQSLTTSFLTIISSYSVIEQLSCCISCGASLSFSTISYSTLHDCI